jgi:RimK family alpha-L-glutamate ligase
MANPRVVIFNDTHGWHSNQLFEELTQLNIDTVLTDLAECTIDLSSPTGLSIPGFNDQLPNAVMVRGIAPGSLEQITLRMDVLHTLAELHVPVFNPATAIEHTVDKARTSLRLHLAGINTPQTWACENQKIAFDIAEKQFSQGYELVVKPLFGCQGKGIEKVSSLDQLKMVCPVGDAFYLQQYIPPKSEGHWQDWRLFVIDNEVCAAMSRSSKHWITNFAQGADCFATTLTSEMIETAINATNAVNAHYAGVDLIQDSKGKFSVLEVNSVPAWKGLVSATKLNVAAQLAQALALRANTHFSQQNITNEA